MAIIDNVQKERDAKQRKEIADQSDKTQRRGQDIAAATARRGQDLADNRAAAARENKTQLTRKDITAAEGT